MQSDFEISWHDVARAAAVVAGVVILVGLLYSGFSTMPGIVWACLAALAAGTLEHWRKCHHGRAGYRQLQGLSRPFVQGAVGAVLVSFLLPMLVPEDSFGSTEWLLWADGALLAGGLLAVPMAHAVLTVACFLARARQPPNRHG